VCVCVCVYVYIHTYIRMWAYISYIYIYMHIYIYICIYIYTCILVYRPMNHQTASRMGSWGRCTRAYSRTFRICTSGFKTCTDVWRLKVVCVIYIRMTNGHVLAVRNNQYVYVSCIFVYTRVHVRMWYAHIQCTYTHIYALNIFIYTHAYRH
jgi:hypothetical protein